MCGVQHAQVQADEGAQQQLGQEEETPKVRAADWPLDRVRTRRGSPHSRLVLFARLGPGLYPTALISRLPEYALQSVLPIAKLPIVARIYPVARLISSLCRRLNVGFL